LLRASRFPTRSPPSCYNDCQQQYGGPNPDSRNGLRHPALAAFTRAQAFAMSPARGRRTSYKPRRTVERQLRRIRRRRSPIQCEVAFASFFGGPQATLPGTYNLAIPGSGRFPAGDILSSVCDGSLRSFPPEATAAELNSKVSSTISLFRHLGAR